ncbi:MAG: hypothetical protein ABFS37_10290 [Acidobacteriota bacterium]
MREPLLGRLRRGQAVRGAAGRRRRDRPRAQRDRRRRGGRRGGVRHVAAGGGDEHRRRDLVVWVDDRTPGKDVYGARIAEDGTILDPGGFLISDAPDNQYYTDVAFNGTHFLVVWSDYRNGDWDIYGARVTPNATVLDPTGIQIYSAPNNQAYPSVASDGSGWLVSWGAIGEIEIRGARVAADGTPLDPSGIVISSGAEQRLWPDISFDGTNFFVAWQDTRSGTTTGDWAIYGSRVTPAGTVLDPAGIAIAANPTHYEGLVSLDFDGTNHLVAWRDNPNFEITGARVSPDGTVLDPGGFHISGGPGYEDYPAVAHDGANWMVAWEDARASAVPPGSGSDIAATRVDSTGTVLDTYPDDTVVALSANWQFLPTAAFDGTNYLVVWQDKYLMDEWNLLGTRIDPLGTILDDPPLVVSSWAEDQVNAELAAGTTCYLAVWNDFRNNEYIQDVYATRIGFDGTVLDTDGLVLATDDYSDYPAVAFDGTNFLVVWWQFVQGPPQRYEVWGARVAQDGTILDPGGFPIIEVTWDYGWNFFMDVSVASDGTNFLVVWPDFRNGNWDIHGTRVSSDGTVLDPGGLQFSNSTQDESFPDVTFGGGSYLAVWELDASGGQNVYGVRIDSTGTVLDPSGIALTTAAGDQTIPQVGFDGTDFWAAWDDDRGDSIDVYGTRVAQDGTVLDPGGTILVGGNDRQRTPSVAGSSFGQALIAFSGFTGDPYRSSRAYGLFHGETSQAIFSDGFESGDTGSWSVTSP